MTLYELWLWWAWAKVITVWIAQFLTSIAPILLIKNANVTCALIKAKAQLYIELQKLNGPYF